VYLEELILKPEHSLIDQSLESRSGATTTNGDGFGIGWYGDRETPGVYKNVQPAWNDNNLRDLTAHIESPCFSRIYAQPQAPRSSRPTAIRFAIKIGFSSTTV